MTRRLKLALLWTIITLIAALSVFESLRSSPVKPISNAAATSATPVPLRTLSPADKIERRKAFIRQLESGMLEQGHDFYLSLRGKEQDQLHIKYILMSRPAVYQLANDDDLKSALYDLGFTKIIATDGYNDTWTIDLQ